jgi:hypothetical protein
LDAHAVRDFLTHLAVKENVSASTQNQAFNALLFLYRHLPLYPSGKTIDTLKLF